MLGCVYCVVYGSVQCSSSVPSFLSTGTILASSGIVPLSRFTYLPVILPESVCRWMVWGFRALLRGLCFYIKFKVMSTILTFTSSKKSCQFLPNYMRLYGRINKKAPNYPNGIRLRFVKLKKDALNAEEKGK